jgi:hypothetical protein
MTTPLLLGLLLSAALPASVGPPLCRVTASVRGIPFPPLRTITVKLRPECPTDGHAFVRLKSTSGATDPAFSWDELTFNAPSILFRGVLPNWSSEWQAGSGKTYRIPETLSRPGGP